MKLTKIESLFAAGLTRRHFSQLGALAWLGALLLLLQAIPAAAVPVVFTVDSTNSTFTQSGSVTSGGITMPILEQGPGSLTTHYSGTVLANLTPPLLQFPGGSLVVALTNGIWQPAAGGAAGTAAADSAGKITYSVLIFSLNGYIAGRNLKLDLSSPALTLTNSGFDGSQLAITYLTNSAPLPVTDYRLVSTIPGVNSTNGSTLISGTINNSPSRAYLTNAAGLLKLVIPVNVTNVSSSSTTNNTTTILNGQLVATAPASVWPLTTTVGVTNGQVTLTWPSVAGQSFIVRVSSDLQTWNNATGVTVVNGNTTTWTTTASGSVQFYRVQMQ